MSMRPGLALFLSMMIVGIVFAPIGSSYAQTADYTYDQLNRLGQAAYPDGHALQYTYDAAGNRVGMASATLRSLSVAKSGTGAGTITSADGGIDCGDACWYSYFPGTQVTLTATPDANSAFSGWSGCDSTNGNTCTVTMTAGKSPVATFSPGVALSVNLSGSGSGVVSSSDGTIMCGNYCADVVVSGPLSGSFFGAAPAATALAASVEPCGAACTANFPIGSQVTLTATPQNYSTFSGWSGCNSVSGNSCTITLQSASNVGASFGVGYGLMIDKAGTGWGTVTSSDNSINCGSTCSFGYAPGTVVTLTATPQGDSTFAGWSGCDSVMAPPVPSPCPMGRTLWSPSPACPSPPGAAPARGTGNSAA